jgi:hypothetical protein
MAADDGERDLDYLLKNMQPILDKDEVVFCSLPSYQADEYLNLCQGFYEEREGTTLILGKTLADLHKLEYGPVFRRITLNVHSSLEAVGFLARISEVLAAQGISLNVVSAYYHDYLYIKSEQAKDALNYLMLWRDNLNNGS